MTTPDASLLRPSAPRPPHPRRMRFWLATSWALRTTGLSAIPYVREENPATNGPAPPASPRGPQARVTMEFVDDTAVVKKIRVDPRHHGDPRRRPPSPATSTPASSTCSRCGEQAQIINGAGSGAQLKGILQFSGVTGPVEVAGDVPATIAQAIARSRTSTSGQRRRDEPARLLGVGVHPVRQPARRRHGRQRPVRGPGADPVGLPVIRTRALASSGGTNSGRAIVADWAMGATLFDRMQATVRQSDSHDTFFIYNKVAILAEERIALAVHRPDAFVSTTIDTAA